jgi:hypothetical protein
MGDNLDDLTVVEARRADGLNIRVRDLPPVPPQAPRTRPTLFKAAGELATALNMFGAVPNAPLISSSSGFVAPVAVAGSTRFTLAMNVSIACKKAVALQTRTPF